MYIYSAVTGPRTHVKLVRVLLRAANNFYGKCSFELAMFMTFSRFRKEYFNSFDDIQFFHKFSSISRDIVVTRNEIHH